MKDHESVNSKWAEEIRLLTSFCMHNIFLVKWNISLIIIDIIICVVIYLRSVSRHRPKSYLSVSLCCNDNSTAHIIFSKNERCKWNQFNVNPHGDLFISCLRYGPNSHFLKSLSCRANDNSTAHIIFSKNERCKWNPEFEDKNWMFCYPT